MNVEVRKGMVYLVIIAIIYMCLPYTLFAMSQAVRESVISIGSFTTTLEEQVTVLFQERS